jgi:hypothetical protein
MQGWRLLVAKKRPPEIACSDAAGTAGKPFVYLTTQHARTEAMPPSCAPKVAENVEVTYEWQRSYLRLWGPAMVRGDNFLLPAGDDALAAVLGFLARRCHAGQPDIVLELSVGGIADWAGVELPRPSGHGRWLSELRAAPRKLPLALRGMRLKDQDVTALSELPQLRSFLYVSDRHVPLLLAALPLLGRAPQLANITLEESLGSRQGEEEYARDLVQRGVLYTALVGLYAAGGYRGCVRFQGPHAFGFREQLQGVASAKEYLAFESIAADVSID